MENFNSIELSLTPFTEQELSEDYTTNTFIESGVEFTLLRLSNQFKINTSKSYKFGVVDADYNFYWFFCNKPLVKGRKNAIEVFTKLQSYCIAKNIGQPFAYKV
jgi:hypothetical protein